MRNCGPERSCVLPKDTQVVAHRLEKPRTKLLTPSSLFFPTGSSRIRVASFYLPVPPRPFFSCFLRDAFMTTFLPHSKFRRQALISPFHGETAQGHGAGEEEAGWPSRPLAPGLLFSSLCHTLFLEQHPLWWRCPNARDAAKEEQWVSLSTAEWER